jgi:hypothetical protein
MKIQHILATKWEGVEKAFTLLRIYITLKKFVVYSFNLLFLGGWKKAEEKEQEEMLCMNGTFDGLKGVFFLNLLVKAVNVHWS